MIFKSLARTETAAVVIKLLLLFFSYSRTRNFAFLFSVSFVFERLTDLFLLGTCHRPWTVCLLLRAEKGVSSQLLKKNICPAILSSDGFRQLHIMLVYGSLVRFPTVERDLLFCNRTYHFWGASSLLINGYLELSSFSAGKAAWA